MHFSHPLFALLTTACALPSASALPKTPSKSHSVKPQDIINALAGTYTLVNTSSTLNDIPIPDAAYGASPIGILTYSRTGYMSATITASEPSLRPQNLTFPFQPTDSDADWSLIGKHSLGYAGPVSVNTALPASLEQGQLFHGPLVVANVPAWVGTQQRRNYTVVKQDGEVWVRIGSERGGGYRGVLWWRRVD